MLFGFVFQLGAQERTSDSSNDSVAHLVTAKGTSCTSGQRTHQTAFTILSSTRGSIRASLVVALRVVRIIWSRTIRSLLRILRSRLRAGVLRGTRILSIASRGAVLALSWLAILLWSGSITLRSIGILIWLLSMLEAAGCWRTILALLLMWRTVLALWRSTVLTLWWITLLLLLIVARSSVATGWRR
jgi:hypothetical protein